MEERKGKKSGDALNIPSSWCALELYKITK